MVVNLFVVHNLSNIQINSLNLLSHTTHTLTHTHTAATTTATWTQTQETYSVTAASWNGFKFSSNCLMGVKDLTRKAAGADSEKWLKLSDLFVVRHDLKSIESEFLLVRLLYSFTLSHHHQLMNIIEYIICETVAQLGQLVCDPLSYFIRTSNQDVIYVAFREYWAQL